MPDLRSPDVTHPDLPAVRPARDDPAPVGGRGRRRAPRARRAIRPVAVGAVVVTVGVGVTMIGFGWHGKGPPQPPARAAIAPPVSATNVKPLKAARPTSISIPKIHVSAPIEPMGQNLDGTVQVPTLTRPNLAGWYRNSPTPGQRGAAVVLGHVDAHKHRAVFFDLGRLRRGDHISIARAGGSTAKFVIDSVVRVPKDRFPTEKVYGRTSYPALRLVTCGGKYDKKTMHYLANVIVYAHLVR